MKAWLAFWMDGKTRRSKTFSSKMFGFDEARKAAVEFLLSRRRETGCIFPEESDVTPPCTPALLSSEASTAAVSCRPSESSVISNIC
jgi:hypothetical protein